MAETALSFAIIGFATLVVFGLLYGAGWGAFEDFSNAREANAAEDLQQFETEFNVTEVRWDEGDPVVNGDERLIVTVNNTGSTTLAVNGTDLLVDGRYAEYSSDNVTATVDGTDASIWSPRTTLRVVVDDGFIRSTFDLDLTADAKPDRVRFVTESGIAASQAVP